MISQTIHERINRLRKTIRLLFLVNGLGYIVLFALLFSIGTFLIDRFIPQLPGGVRIFFLGAGILGVLYLAWKYLLYPLRVAITDEDIALCVERNFPDLHERLISSLQLDRSSETKSGNSSELIEALVNETNQAIQTMDFRKIVDARQPKKLVMPVLGIALIIAIYTAFYPQDFSIWLNRLLGGQARWPKSTELVVEVKDLVVPKGSDVPVTVIARKGYPSKVYIHYKFDSGETGEERMRSTASRTFKFDFIRVLDSFQFYATGGDDQTNLFRIQALTPPRMEKILLYYTYPAYTKLPNTDPNKPEENGMIKAPIGTKIRFTAMTNIELVESRMFLGKRSDKQNRQTVNLQVTKDDQNKARLVTGEITVLNDSEYELEFKSQNELRNTETYSYPIKALVDTAPVIKIIEPATDHKYLTPVAVLPIKTMTSDDYGITAIALDYKTITAPGEGKPAAPAETPVSAVPFGAANNNAPYGNRQIETNYAFDMNQLHAVEGMLILYSIEATDNCEIPNPQKTRTPEYQITIVSKSQLEKQIEDKELLLKEEVRKMSDLQKQEKSAMTKLLEFLKTKDNFSPDETKALSQSISNQRKISQNTERLTHEFNDVTKDVSINKLFDAATLDKLQTIKQTLQDVSAVKSPQAAELMNQAGYNSSGADKQNKLKDTQTVQDDILNDLQTVLNKMEEWEDYQEVVRLVRELKEKQTRIKETIKNK